MVYADSASAYCPSLNLELPRDLCCAERAIMEEGADTRLRLRVGRMREEGLVRVLA